MCQALCLAVGTGVNDMPRGAYSLGGKTETKQITRK